MTIHPALYSSQTDQHNTPAWLVDKIHHFLGFIHLDPCTDASNPTGAMNFYTESTDGLAQAWHADTLFMNPPYGRGIGQWTAKLAAEYATGHVLEAVALLPARTDTQWWQHLAPHPVCLLTGRLQFNDCGQSAPFPSALFYLGQRIHSFWRQWSMVGTVYVPANKVWAARPPAPEFRISPTQPTIMECALPGGRWGFYRVCDSAADAQRSLAAIQGQQGAADA